MIYKIYDTRRNVKRLEQSRWTALVSGRKSLNDRSDRIRTVGREGGEGGRKGGLIRERIRASESILTDIIYFKQADGEGGGARYILTSSHVVGR